MGESEALIRSCTPLDPTNHTTPARVPDGDITFERGESDASTFEDAYRLRAARSAGQMLGRRYRVRIPASTNSPE